MLLPVRLYVYIIPSNHEQNMNELHGICKALLQFISTLPNNNSHFQMLRL